MAGWDLSFLARIGNWLAGPGAPFSNAPSLTVARGRGGGSSQQGARKPLALKHCGWGSGSENTALLPARLRSPEASATTPTLRTCQNGASERTRRPAIHATESRELVAAERAAQLQVLPRGRTALHLHMHLHASTATTNVPREEERVRRAIVQHSAPTLVLMNAHGCTRCRVWGLVYKASVVGMLPSNCSPC